MNRQLMRCAAGVFLLALAACGISPSGENTSVTVGVNRNNAFADFSTVVTATATVTRNGSSSSGVPVTFTLSPAVTLLTPATGLSTDRNGQATVRFKRFPFFSNTSTATVSAQFGSVDSSPQTVTFIRPTVGTNLLTISPDPTTIGRFLFQGFGLGSAGGTGVGGMTVTIRYAPQAPAPLTSQAVTDLFGGALVVNANTPGQVVLSGISLDPLAANGRFATFTFPPGSGSTITGMTVNTLTDASLATTPLASRTVVVNP